MQSPDGLFISSDALNFGETWESEYFQWNIRVENRRNEDVRIREFHSTCNCSSIEPRTATIPAGQAHDFHLVLDLRPHAGDEISSEWRDFLVGLFPNVTDEPEANGRRGWQLRGRVRAAVAFDPRGVDLGRHSEFAQALPIRKLLLTTFVPIDRLIAKSSSAMVHAKANRSAANANGIELEVSADQLPIGAVDETIRITPVLESGERLPSRSLPVTGRIVSDIQASPPAVLFGTRCVGEVAQETVVLVSLTKRQFEVVGVTCEGNEDLAVEQLSGQTNSEPAFRVTQRVADVREHTGRVTINVRFADKREANLAVPVSCLGIAASPR